MTRRVGLSRNALEESRRRLQIQHKYLETVLAGLSTGVMALDSEGRIQTANRAADQILGLPGGRVAGPAAEDIGGAA